MGCKGLGRQCSRKTSCCECQSAGICAATAVIDQCALVEMGDALQSMQSNQSSLCAQSTATEPRTPSQELVRLGKFAEQQVRHQLLIVSMMQVSLVRCCLYGLDAHVAPFLVHKLKHLSPGQHCARWLCREPNKHAERNPQIQPQPCAQNPWNTTPVAEDAHDDEDALDCSGAYAAAMDECKRQLQQMRCAFTAKTDILTAELAKMHQSQGSTAAPGSRVGSRAIQ
jgi:hypothetical protein